MRGPLAIQAGGRVARRVLWLFVVSTLIPLVLSDGVASMAVSDLAVGLNEREQSRLTRQTSLQVFDRLVAARSLLATVAELPVGSNAEPLLLSSGGAARMFKQVARLPGTGDDTLGGDLGAAWRAGQDGAPTLQAVADVWPHARIVLRLAPAVDGTIRLLLGAGGGAVPGWVVELEPAFVWGPIADAAIDSVWSVTDEHGRLLAGCGDASTLGAAAGRIVSNRTTLFLGGDFGAADWEFAQRSVVVGARWQGMPLTVWLALVAGATVLVSALLTMRQLRRTLVPLQQLTTATRELAEGRTATRVALQGDDEFAQLGGAFNDMAARIASHIETLQVLASIDRDVLAGTSIEVVAGRVLSRMTERDPCRVAAIGWLGTGHRAALAGWSMRGGDAAASRFDRTLAAEEAAFFFASSAAEPVDVPPGGMLEHLLQPGAGDACAVVPLRSSPGAMALLALRVPGAHRADAVALATELRDRLAVALSAREREAEMTHRATHDSLTGLANRHQLNEFVDAKLDEAKAASAPSPLAVLFIDLDHFKDANDSLGHEAGDRVLCQAGARLVACAPAGALVARSGGDEFVLVLAGAGEEEARRVAADVVRCLILPFDIGGGLHPFGASVGIAVAPGHGTTRSELLRHADAAMYVAKASGRGRFHVFDDSFEVAAQERLRLPTEMRRALDQGEFVAYYQPRVCPRTGRMTSVEALVRWHHPTRGLLLPAAFIAQAEESALIEDIGAFMLDDACARVAAWRRQGLELQRVSVNVSPRQLVSGDLPRAVRAALDRHGLEPGTLELEVTESLLVEDASQAHAQLAALRETGVRIALDDFGTGYSSMAMLRRLPIDVMKVDRAFVKDLGVDEGALAVTRAIATLARALGLHLVAEGVETRHQAALLAEIGFDEFQGFLYSPPLPPERLEAFAAASASRELSYEG